MIISKSFFSSCFFYEPYAIYLKIVTKSLKKSTFKKKNNDIVSPAPAALTVVIRSFMFIRCIKLCDLDLDDHLYLVIKSLTWLQGTFYNLILSTTTKSILWVFVKDWGSFSSPGVGCWSPTLPSWSHHMLCYEG